MKTYIKPTTVEVQVKSQYTLLGTSNGVKSVSGLTDVETSSEAFGGGAADSRRGVSLWDEYEE